MDKVTRQCPQTTTFLKRRAEEVSNRGPSAYRPNALPLGQTGSQALPLSRLSPIIMTVKWLAPYAFRCLEQVVGCVLCVRGTNRPKRSEGGAFNYIFILLWNTTAFLFHSPGLALVVVVAMVVVVVLVVAVVEGVPANCCSPSSPPSTPCRLPVFSAPPPFTTPTLSLRPPLLRPPPPHNHNHHPGPAGDWFAPVPVYTLWAKGSTGRWQDFISQGTPQTPYLRSGRRSKAVRRRTEGEVGRGEERGCKRGGGGWVGRGGGCWFCTHVSKARLCMSPGLSLPFLFPSGDA